MQILQAKKPNTNVGEAERWLSLVGGSSLIAYGLARRNTAGFGLAALGGSLLWRGATGPLSDVRDARRQHSRARICERYRIASRRAV